MCMVADLGLCSDFETQSVIDAAETCRLRYRHAFNGAHSLDRFGHRVGSSGCQHRIHAKYAHDSRDAQAVFARVEELDAACDTCTEWKTLRTTLQTLPRCGPFLAKEIAQDCDAEFC